MTTETEIVITVAANSIKDVIFRKLLF